MNQTPNNFRYDIAFLRAFAVIIVVCFHLKIPYFQKGFMGVDVFFVLSGYLMTGLLLSKETLSVATIAQFYLARIKRLLPALLTVLLVFIVPIYFIVGIKLYDYSRFALSSLLFVSNGYNYLNSGYFDASSELNFLLHTWTLSLEGQFYFLFPLLVFGARRWLGNKNGHLLLVLLLTILVSFSLLIILKNQNPSYAFYSLESRFWEFIFGSLAFILTKMFSSRISARLGKVFTLTGLLILGLVIFLPLTEGKLIWPSWMTILPVGAVSFVILGKRDFSIFRHPIVLFIASRSYAWYLWHWPLVVLFYYLNLGDLWWIKIGLFFGSLFLANLTYLYLERNSYLANPRRLFISITCCAVLFFLGSQARSYDFIFSKDQASLFRFFYHYPRDMAPAQYGFHYAHVRDKGNFEDFDKHQLLRLSSDSANFLLLGDCHAGMFSRVIKEIAEQQGVRLLQATADDAFPSQHATVPFAGPKALMDYIFNEYLPRFHQRIDRVILMANYAGYTKAQLTKYFEQNDRYFADLGIPVTYISQTEKYALEYPVLKWMHRSVGLNPQDRLLTFPANANHFVKSILKDTNYVDIFNKVADQHLIDSSLYLYDAEHFSVQGTINLKEALVKGIFVKN